MVNRLLWKTGDPSQKMLMVAHWDKTEFNSVIDFSIVWSLHYAALIEPLFEGSFGNSLCYHIMSGYWSEPAHDKTNKVACAPSEDSDQPGHPPSLISVFAVRMKKAWVLSYPLSAKQRLIRLDGCPGWSESAMHIAILLVLSWGGSSMFQVRMEGLALRVLGNIIWLLIFSYSWNPAC